MQKKTHLIMGLLLGSILFAFGFPLSYAILLGFSAYIPDLDFLLDKVWLKPKGFVKKKWKQLTGGGMHRRIFHNIWFGIVYALIVGYFTQWSLSLILLAFIGFLSHLLIDSLTYTGIYWFWPYGDLFGRKNAFYIRGKFITGSRAEFYLRISLEIIAAIFIAIGLLKLNYINLNHENFIITLSIVFLSSVTIIENLEKLTNRLTNQLNIFKHKRYRRF